ncbi:hypothetical protein TGRH88_060230 [Toxoplasma gondii]|uniref:Transmembrane protein n=1 Tax=Toxoplasma gondii TaxID=5811 RepID=A0A7J6JTE7_TOXGO|nr:hypothetical protein TGRH88_060230 [Toxoplasma gondii]
MAETALYYQELSRKQAPQPHRLRPASAPRAPSSAVCGDSLHANSTELYPLQTSQQCSTSEHSGGSNREPCLASPSLLSVEAKPQPQSTCSSAYINSMYRPPILSPQGTVVPPTFVGVPPAPPSLPSPGEISMTALGLPETETKTSQEQARKHAELTGPPTSSPYHVTPPSLLFSPFSIGGSEKRHPEGIALAGAQEPLASHCPRCRESSSSFWEGRAPSILGCEDASPAFMARACPLHAGDAGGAPWARGVSLAVAFFDLLGRGVSACSRSLSIGPRQCYTSRVAVLLRVGLAVLVALAVLLFFVHATHGGDRSRAPTEAEIPQPVNREKDSSIWDAAGLPHFASQSDSERRGGAKPSDSDFTWLEDHDTEEASETDERDAEESFFMGGATQLVHPGVGVQGKGACRGRNYLSHTLRLAHEQSFFSLFANTQGMAKYEASDVIGVDGSLYTVFDSSYAIGHTSYTLRPFDDTNYLIGNPKRTGDEDSQWEAITYDEVTKRFFIVREAIVMEEHTPWTPTTTSSAAPNEQKEAAAAPSPSKKAGKVHKSKTANHGGKDEAEPARSAEVETRGATKNAGKLEHYHAVIEEVEISEKSYKVVQACRTEFSFSAQNKGFEGVISLRDTNGKFFLLGLCEGNYCKGGAKGRKRGNGRLVLMEKVEAAGTGEQCIWTTVRVLHLPREVAFTDYSSIAVRGSHLAITSQEDSVVWLGKFNMPEDKPNHSDGGTGVEASVDAPKMLLTDPAALEVVPGGQVLNFPRDEQCNIIYCNIEGIAFAGRLLVTVADKVKAWQDPRCMATDQRVHAFVLPPNFKY